MDPTLYFKKAIGLYQNVPANTSNKALIKMLKKEYIAVDVSTCLAIFIPLALGRIICGELNINFTDE